MHKQPDGHLRHIITSKNSKILILDFYPEEGVLEFRMKSDENKVLRLCALKRYAFDLLVEYDVDNSKELDKFFQEEIVPKHSCVTN